MRSSAACLTLLLLLSMISVAGIQQSNAYEIVSHGIFADVHVARVNPQNTPEECGVHNYYCASKPTRTFTLNSPLVYLVVHLKIEKADLSSYLAPRSEWRDPTGKVFQRGKVVQRVPKIFEMSPLSAVRPLNTADDYMIYDQLLHTGNRVR
jgi:hypothetical protein